MTEKQRKETRTDFCSSVCSVYRYYFVNISLVQVISGKDVLCLCGWCEKTEGCSSRPNRVMLRENKFKKGYLKKKKKLDKKNKGNFTLLLLLTQTGNIEQQYSHM